MDLDLDLDDLLDLDFGAGRPGTGRLGAGPGAVRRVCFGADLRVDVGADLRVCFGAGPDAGHGVPWT